MLYPQAFAPLALCNPTFGMGLGGGQSHVILRTTNAGGFPLFRTAAAHGLVTGKTVAVIGTPNNDGVDTVTVLDVVVFKFQNQPFLGNTFGGLWS